MKRIEVAVGIICDDAGRVLVGQRTVKDNYFQKWEFPGGKLEAGENPEQTLVRELYEELGIDIEESEPLISLQHDYPDRNVLLYVQIVLCYRGEVKSNEGQALQWLAPTEIDRLDFLEGNQPIIDYLIASED